VAILLNLVKNA